MNRIHQFRWKGDQFASTFPVSDGVSLNSITILAMIDIYHLLQNIPRGSGVTIYASGNVEFRSFAFVLNVKELVDAENIEIAPGCLLRRAQKAELEFIKEFLKERFGTESSSSIWENQPTASGQEPKLARRRWRYFVIEFSNDDPDLDLLEAALAVAPNSLEIGFAKIRMNLKGVIKPACIFRAPSLFQSLSALNSAGADRDSRMQSIGNAEGQHIRETFLRMSKHDNRILELSTVVELLLELKDLPKFSPLQILGYFAILEALLTHQPNPDDRYESITRQITKKLALLNGRWEPALDYSPFSGAIHDKIWAKMYAYRSAIAHGRRPDFNSELALLKSSNAANELIRDAVKKVLRHAYLEPRLVGDLHNV